MPSDYTMRDSRKVLKAELNSGSALCSVVSLYNTAPVDHVPPGSDIISSPVSVFKVVGVFPDIDSHDWESPPGREFVLVLGLAPARHLPFVRAPFLSPPLRGPPAVA